MDRLDLLTRLVTVAAMVGIGQWMRRECRHRREFELDARVDRRDIREIAERADSEAAACAAQIDRMDKQPARRRLSAVHDERTGKASWHWE